MKRYFFIACPLFFFITLFLYGSMLNNFFISDDFLWMENAWKIDNDLLRMLNTQSVGHAFFRPIVQLSFWICYKLFGLDSTGFYWFNILNHSANIVLFGAIIYVLYRKLWMAVSGGLIFLINGAYAESVLWLSGRTELIAGFFALATVLNILLFYQKDKTRFFFISILTCILTLGSKETYITLPFVAALIHWVSLKKKYKSFYANHWFVYVSPYFILLGLYIVLHGLTFQFSGAQVFNLQSYDFLKFFMNTYKAVETAFMFQFSEPVKPNIWGSMIIFFVAELLVIFVIGKKFEYIRTDTAIFNLMIFLISPYTMFVIINSWRMYIPAMLLALFLVNTVSQSFSLSSGIYFKTIITATWIILFTGAFISGRSGINEMEMQYHASTNKLRQYFNTIIEKYPTLPKNSRIYTNAFYSTNYLEKYYGNDVHVNTFSRTGSELANPDSTELGENAVETPVKATLVLDSNKDILLRVKELGQEMVHIFVLRKGKLEEISAEYLR
ncbi:MAG: hypothetical protein A2161_12125 [Candidatus Schekmanbacteria bacterium RBG_13_48_7]|uniref:Glycosyltransferase RgtA/B/C/D-like domain-containing protein n=1 Tax=Candidatus Schekmanbacteria bacterium RBG_13_48_7 TaxID=1817878 RepID=A0A1F7RTI7_9BACT|nr:MAG: hypothetical protein A2161_12125 [Candidatus Schekmanbacteria bacterium RBG_13_48_7]